MFYNCSSLISLNLSNFDTSNIINMNSIFYNCSSLTSINISNFNTSKVVNIISMFNGCSSLTSVDLSTFNTTKLKNITNLFNNCIKLSYIDISTFSELLNYTNDVFQNIYYSGTIKVNNKISIIIEKMFEDLKMNWTIITN